MDFTACPFFLASVGLVSAPNDGSKTMTNKFATFCRYCGNESFDHYQDMQGHLVNHCAHSAGIIASIFHKKPKYHSESFWTTFLAPTANHFRFH